MHLRGFHVRFSNSSLWHSNSTKGPLQKEKKKRNLDCLPLGSCQNLFQLFTCPSPNQLHFSRFLNYPSNWYHKAFERRTKLVAALNQWKAALLDSLGNEPFSILLSKTRPTHFEDRSTVIEQMGCCLLHNQIRSWARAAHRGVFPTWVPHPRRRAWNRLQFFPRFCFTAPQSVHHPRLHLLFPVPKGGT